jgi:hypothetical protein
MSFCLFSAREIIQSVFEKTMKAPQGALSNSPAHRAASRITLDAKPCKGEITYAALTGLCQEAYQIPVAMPQAITLRPCGAFQTASH